MPRRRRSPSVESASAHPSEAAARSEDLAEPLADRKQSRTSAKPGALSDLSKLRQQVAEQRSKLQLRSIREKQDRDIEEFKHEYFQGTLDTPIGPSGRYIVKDTLGRGIFATVHRCVDKQDGSEAAVKVIRSSDHAKCVGMKELAMLKHLCDHAATDLEGSRYILNLVGCKSFELGGHLAFVFPVMKCDLRTGLSKYGQGRGLPLVPTVRNFARSTLLALRFLHTLDIIHADLKPDNLLISMDKLSVRLCDFGCALHMIDRAHSDYVIPRYYRPPEIIVGQSYNCMADVWSAGATLFEAATDRVLFDGESNGDVVGQILRTCGAFPQQMTAYGGFVHKHFTKDRDFLQPDRERGIKRKIPMKDFAKPSHPVLQLLTARLQESGKKDEDTRALSVFADLLSGCLAIDPDMRLTPDHALRHGFFR